MEGARGRGIANQGDTTRRRHREDHRGEEDGADAVRISRYVEDERRKGGSLEQMIEVGRVSVHRTEEGRRTREGTAATPPHVPG